MSDFEQCFSCPTPSACGFHEQCLEKALSRTPSHGRASGEAALAVVREMLADGLVGAAIHYIDRRALSTPPETVAAPIPVEADGDDEGPCTDCWDTGVTIQTERRCACQPEIAAAKTDDEKLADLVETHMFGVLPDDQCMVLDDDDWQRIMNALRSHRLTFSRGVDEKAQIIAWLRNPSETFPNGKSFTRDSEFQNYAEGFADAIERGDHLSTIKEPRA